MPNLSVCDHLQISLRFNVKEKPMRDQVAHYMNNTITRRVTGVYDYPFYYPDYITSETNYSGQTLQRWRGRSDITPSDGSRPTYYRAYKMDVTALQNTMQEPFPGWTWGWRFPPEVPSSGRMWYYYRTTYTGQAYISDVYTRRHIDPDGFPIVPTVLKNEVRTKCLNQLAESEVNLAQSAGEAREAAEFVLVQLGRAIGALRAIKNRQFRKAARILRIKFDKRTMADNWLAYHFGMVPLLNDIYNGVDAIRKAQVKSDRIRVSSVAVDSAPFPVFSSYSYEGKFTRGVSAAYNYRLEDKRLASLTTLGLTNPLALTWELLPGSYLVDWFISVGNVLTALASDMGYVYEHGYETQFVKGDFAISSTAYPGPGAWGWQVKSFAMERISAPPPKPGLYIKSGLNLNKGLTALALKTKGLG